ncbi:hypothetical protein OF83DRAFT_1177980 [Amylostereum chailletii]|nr:hypothetical protein OF83DRAFT_1177980 [Amylostereum chailletii]
MLQLPAELRIRIFKIATYVPNLFDTTISPENIFLPSYFPIEDLEEMLQRSLPTRRALTFVCRNFNVLATPMLYSCLLINLPKIPQLSPGFSFDPLNGPFVRHEMRHLLEPVLASISPISQISTSCP